MAPAKPFRVEALLPAPAHTYFLERDSAAFRSLLSKVLKIGQLEFNDLWHEGSCSFVRMVTKPEFGSWVPKSVAGQLQSSNLEFHDIIEYNPAHIAAPPYKIFVRTESPFLKDKLDIQLTLTIEEVEPGVSCRQVLEGHLRVKMFGVGRIVEGIVKDSLVNTYKKLPEIVRRWQLFREEALARGDGRQLLLGRPPVGCKVTWIRQEVLQVLKEPLPEGDGEVPGTGTDSPVSALSPVAGASEASEESPARKQQRRAAAAAQRAAGAAEAEAVFASAAAAQQQQAQQGQDGQNQQQPSSGIITEEQLEDLRAGRRASVTVSEYYDAREVCDDELPLAGRAPLQPPPKQQESWPTGAAQGVEPALPQLQAAPQQTSSLAAAAPARGAHHRRGLSIESATSTDTPTTEGGQPRAPGSRRFWRRFNRDYGEWDVYWDTVGVENDVDLGEVEGGDEAPGSGGIVGRALQAVEEVMRDSYYSTSILVALFMLRRGWLRVEPESNSPTHDEALRRHEGHRHRRTGSSDAASTASEPRSGASDAGLSSQPQSLARVAQEVYGRMVSGPRKPGSSLWQASVPGARTSAGGTNGNGRASDMWPAGSGSIAAGQAAAGHAAAPPVAADGLGRSSRHRKTMSLDTGTAAAAQEAAAAALFDRERQRQQGHAGGGSGAAVESPPLPPGWSPRKQVLERRPSDMANAAAMASMQRTEHRVRGPSRLSCFGVCRRLPAVKD